MSALYAFLNAAALSVCRELASPPRRVRHARQKHAAAPREAVPVVGVGPASPPRVVEAPRVASFMSERFDANTAFAAEDARRREQLDRWIAAEVE